MTWAEVLAVFNFITWLVPIAFRTWVAWKYDSTSKYTISDKELSGIRGSIAKLNIRGKKFNISDGTKTDRDIQEGNK